MPRISSPGQRLLRWAAGAGLLLLWMGPVMLALGIALGYYWDAQGLSYGWPWTFAKSSQFRLLDASPYECWTSWDTWEEFRGVALLGNGLVFVGFALAWWWVCWGLGKFRGKVTLLRWLILITLLAGGLGLVRHRIDQHRRHTQIVEQLARLQFLAQQKETSPFSSQGGMLSPAGYRIPWKWFWDLVPWHAPWASQVVAARFAIDAQSPLFAQAFELVCQLETAEMVTIQATHASAHPPQPAEKPALDHHNLQKLALLPRLSRLELIGCGLSRRQLQALAPLRCEYLSLSQNPISGQDVAVLVSMPGLKHLDLSFTLVGDEVVPVLLQMPHLEWVNLTGTQVSQQAVDQLERRGIVVTDD